MRLSFRAKLIAIVGTAALALVALVVASTVISLRGEDELVRIQERHLPRLQLGPRLEARLGTLERAFQDAVAARDPEALAATRALEGNFLRDLDGAGAAVTPGQAAVLHAAVDDYYTAAFDVSRRLIAGETGERLVDAMDAMQAKQARATELLKAVTAFNPGELGAAFAAARAAEAAGRRVRVLVSLACLLAVVLLSWWIGRGVLRSLGQVAVGLRRFGAGDFSQPIAVTTRDELADLSAQANQMAESLRRLGEERDRNDWVREALTGLGQETRGELDPSELGTRAVSFLARHLGAPAGALYYLKGRQELALLGAYGLETGEAGTRAAFRLGEGLVGQAALVDQITVVRDPPADYLRVRSGLGEGAPRAIVLLPLRQLGQPRGVLELALFGPWSERAAEALLTVRENLVIAIEVALARVATRELLGETQRQAERLSQQEEELRATNEELQTQQEELRQTNQELVEQTEELERARLGLEQKAAELATVSAYKSQFLANMSHELRTPLNSMLLLSNLLAENEAKNLTDKQVEFAKTIHTAGKDLLGLINQVLDLAKIEAGKHETKIAQVSIRPVAQHLERIFAPLAHDKALALVVEVAPGVPESLTTDGQRLEQILSNLLGNAIKFTKAGQVALRIGPADPAARLGRPDLAATDAWAFSVADTGLGIAAADLDRIFAPFEQVDGAIDRRYGGTGLGLSISRELAELLGGELQVRSTLGEGSSFTLYLPKLRSATSAVAPPRLPPPAPLAPVSPAPEPAAAAAADGGVLLVIEDDLAFADAFADIARGQGLDCVIAGDGATGLRLARERRPAGIVLDVRLPDTDGWRVMEELRFDPATARIPVHFVSAVQGTDRGLALGAVGYLTKPASRADILRVIGSLARPQADGANRVLVVEDDPLTSDSVSKQLAGEKLEVRRAMNGAEALAALERERFGCMVLDLSLPDMDGLQLLERIRQRLGGAAPSVLIYTARALSKAETKVLEAHAEAVVLKDGSSGERLLDEVRLFSRRLRDGLGPRRAIGALHAPAANLSLSGRKVLIADDDMRTAYALSATLRAKGVEVLVADTGRAALEVLEKRPDVEAVLMDVMMPEMDGLEAIRRLRQDPRFATLPIVALTAKVMKGDQERCLEAGATEYLPKPIDGDRLFAVLHHLLRDKSTS